MVNASNFTCAEYMQIHPHMHSGDMPDVSYLFSLVGKFVSG